MKKQTAMALAAVFAMSVAGTALAAPANPFVDVPAKHWAYDAVSKLAQSGVISGYGDGTFKGDKTLTRYEIAVIVGKAIANSDKADAEGKKAIEALKAEFGTELTNLGVRVDNVEKKLDNVKISGEFRIHYATAEDNKDKSYENKARTRLYLNGAIDDQWTYTARLQNVQNLRGKDTVIDHGTATSADDINQDNKTEMDQAYVTGKVLGGTYQFGKNDYTPFQGLVFDTKIKGAAVSYDIGKVAASARYGRLTSSDDTVSNFELSGKSGVVNLGAGYYSVDPKAAKTTNYYEVYAAAPISDVFALSAGYAKSDKDKSSDDTAYTLKLAYKEAALSTPKSFGAWAQYRHIEKDATIATTYDLSSISSDGMKGYEVGFDYIPWKNVVWETYYIDGKSVNTEKDGDFFWSHLRFYF